MGDDAGRLTGVVLYASAAVLVAAGAAWWVRAAPGAVAEDDIAASRQRVEEILPDRADQVDARTHVLRPGDDVDAQGDVRPGAHLLTLVCAGSGQVRIRLGSAGSDSGRAVPCVDAPGPTTLSTALGTNLYLNIAAESDGPAVVRWQLVRAPL